MIEDIELMCRFRASCAGHECLFVIGGQEATYNYKQWLKTGVDLIFLGYAEDALAKTAEAFSAGMDAGWRAIDQIDGVVYQRGGQTVFQPAAPMTQADFDRLTFERAMRLDIPFERYWEQARHAAVGLSFWTSVFIPETVRLYTSSHCPNRCGYCSSHRFLQFSQDSKAPIFMLTAHQVLELVKRAVHVYEAKGFLFSEDEFLSNKDRAMEFCRLVATAKDDGQLPREIVFNCQARIADFLKGSQGNRCLDEEFIDLLMGAGFHSLGLGVESFNDRLLLCPSMNKRGYQEIDTLRVLDMMLSKGLTPQVNVILFIPETTREELFHSMLRAIEIVKKGCQIAVTPLLYDIPGAPRHGDPAYPSIIDSYRHPDTGEEIEITRHFIPQDPELATLAKQVEQIAVEEVNHFKERFTWSEPRLPKTIIGILTFIAVASRLGRKDLAEIWYVDIATLLA